MVRRRWTYARRTGISVARARLRSPRAAALYLLDLFEMSSVVYFAWARGGVDRFFATPGMVAPPLYVTTWKPWSYKTEDSVEATPAVAGGIVFIYSDDSHLHAVNAAIGEPL